MSERGSDPASRQDGDPGTAGEAAPQRTALYERQVDLGARMADFGAG